MVSQTEESLECQVRREYMEGMSVWNLQNKYALQLSRSQIRRMLDGVIRPRGVKKCEPTEEEVARLRDEIKARWTPEQASRRWVGRYLSRPESLGEGLSRELRRMGGNC
jgi:hypothetical protein